MAASERSKAINPPYTVSSGCRSYSSDVATPKLPPPPRSAQRRSGSFSAFAVVTAPSAMTTSADRRLSTAMPYLPISHPRPPPSVSPAIPVVETTPPVVASPWAWVASLNSAQVAPPPARTVAPGASTSMPFIGCRSIIRPPSVTARPATLWPPPRTDTSTSSSRASRTASATSVAARHRAITAGRLSIRPLWILPRLVVAGIALGQHLTGEHRPEPLDVDRPQPT